MRSRASRWLAALAVLGGFALAQPAGFPPADPDTLIHDGWTQLGREPGGSRFSPLTDIDTSNVAGLRLEWVADLGFVGRIQGSPTVWGHRLFVSTRDGIQARDARDGTLLWEYVEDRNERTTTGLPRAAPRGSPVILTTDVATIVVASLPSAPVVVALDVETGGPLWRTDVGDPDFAEALRTNPLPAGDLIVVGPTGADLSPVPGRLIAMSKHDGSIAWTFDLVPVRPDDPVRATWNPVPPGRAYGVGGGSAWNAGAYDEVTGVVIYGTGQPVPSDRLDPRRAETESVSADLYTSSFVALDATTGALRWYHQVVPGDEWSYDQHTVPVVIDATIDGAPRRLAVLATTTGFVVLIDVATGAFLGAHDLVEIGTVHLGYDDEGKALIDASLRRTSEDQIVRVCPGRRWASIAPGAFSPVTGLLYRPNDLACVQIGSGTTPDDWQPGARPTWLLTDSRSTADLFDRWGALTAIDPVEGSIAWSFDVAYPHDAGVLATAGGIVFSAFADRIFRAFDAETGAVLWSQALTAHSDAAPITYRVDGRQYVVVMAGRDTSVSSLPASGLPESLTGPATIFAFSLPTSP